MDEFSCWVWSWWHCTRQPLVPFSPLLAIVVFMKTNKSFLKNNRVYYWCILSHKITHKKLQTIFQAFNLKSIHKTHWLQDNGTGSSIILTCFSFGYKNMSSLLQQQIRAKWFLTCQAVIVVLYFSPKMAHKTKQTCQSGSFLARISCSVDQPLV